MNVLVIGRTRTLLEAARQIAPKHRIVGIVTAAATPEAGCNDDDFRLMAEAIGCPFLLTNRSDPALLSFIRSIQADVAISSHWVSTLSREVFDAIPSGILNAHHGDLPRYRGNAATNWMLLQGESVMYATVHFMEPDSLDSGDIVARRPMSLTHESTIGDVLRFIETSIPSMFLEALDSIEKGTVERVSQSSLGIEGFRCYPRTPLHGKIDWHQSAAQIDALVRATGRPYPGAYSYATIGGQLKRVRIWSTRVVASRTPDLGVPGHVIRNDPLSGESWVYTGEGIIGLRSIQYDEGEEFAPGAVWKSIRFGFQVDLEAELIELRRLISKREV